MGHTKVTIWLRFLRRFVVGVLLIYVCVILTLGGTSVARPVLYEMSGLWLAVLSWGSIAASRRVYPGGPDGGDKPRRSPMLGQHPKIWHWLDVGTTNVAVSLVVAELALQAWAVAGGGSPLIQSNLDVYRLGPGRDYGAGLRGNARGYPGPELSADKKPGTLRIAALGDSFAVGPAVPFADNYLTRLADEMPGVEVGNFGVSSAGPREYREILERDVWDVRPDLVLVSVFVGNDITEALPRPRSLDPRRHALYWFCQRSWKLAQAPARKSSVAGATLPDRLAGPTLSPQVFLDVEARRLAVCLKDTSGSLERKWLKALADLEAIVQSCRRHGVALKVVLIPDEFQVNDAVLEKALAKAGLVRQQLDLDGPQRRLQVFFAKRGVPCLDLLPALRRVPGSYATCDTHWNIQGNHLAAREIAAWLAAPTLIPQQSLDIGSN